MSFIGKVAIKPLGRRDGKPLSDGQRELAVAATHRPVKRFSSSSNSTVIDNQESYKQISLTKFPQVMDTLTYSLKAISM